MQLAQHIANHAAALAPSTAALATSADTSTASQSSYHDVSGADPVAAGSLITAADALLSHMKSQWTGLGPDKAFWSALGRVNFVPASLGLPGM